jgi:aspartyl-tRNA(Asn)/glutamyl-tRNA(Gln) amidotransferase subunit C
MPVEIDIEHVARLARLSLNDEERERLRQQLGLILDHAGKVQEVAAGDVPPTAHPVPQTNVFREDDPGECLSPEDALSGAPDAEEARFKVPPIVEAE